MGLLQTRVIEPVENNLQAQADARGVSLYRYIQMVLTEVGRGNIVIGLVSNNEKLLMEKNCTCAGSNCGVKN